MKNRSVRIFVIAVLAMVLTPILATAQATDNATLTLTGTVPSIVKIGFNNTGTAVDTLNLGDLSTTGDDGTPPSLQYAANVAFDLTVTSANATQAANATVNAVLANTTTVTGFRNIVTYQLDVAGQTNVDLSAGTVSLVTGQAPGANSFSISVTPEVVDLSGFDETSTLSDVNAQGTYEDTLTFEVTAAP